jgi:hypothetical protein
MMKWEKCARISSFNRSTRTPQVASLFEPTEPASMDESVFVRGSQVGVGIRIHFLATRRGFSRSMS